MTIHTPFRRNCLLQCPFVAMAGAILVLVATVVSAKETAIAPRHCHGSVRHLHLAVGNAPSAARSMTVSFASTWAFPDRVAPVAGVFVGTTPPREDADADDAGGVAYDYSDFLADSVFYPEQEDPLTYTILMQHNDPDSDPYHAPFQHHITIGNLEPDTRYYYLPVLGNREHGIEGLESHARLHLELASVRDELQNQQEGSSNGGKNNPHAVDIQSEPQLTEEEQEKIEKELLMDRGGGGRSRSRTLRSALRKQHLEDEVGSGGTSESGRTLQSTPRKQRFEYDEAYLARDRDTADANVVGEIPPEEPRLWDQNGRRLSPPPYDPTGIPCIDAGKVRSFETAPDDEQISAEALYPMHFGVIGDIGQFAHSQDVLNHLQEHNQNIRAVVLVGDIAYPDYDGRKWDTFFDFLDDQSHFDEIPLMIAAGNHDIDKQYAGNEIFLAYEHRFRMPRVKPPELEMYYGDCEEKNDGKMNMDAPPYPLPYEWGNAYYAFTYGPARHVIVNVYSDMSPGSPQYEWLKGELASIDRQKTPWVLLTMHAPIYNTFDKHHYDPQIFAAKEHLEPLFVEYSVNMVLTGHIHAYQRTDYVAFENVTDTGPMHITIGAGGRACEAPFMNKEPEEWLQARDASMYGYGRITIQNETHAQWRWIPVAPADDHDYNQLKGDKDLHLPSLDHDKVMIENQYFRRLRKLSERKGGP